MATEVIGGTCPAPEVIEVIHPAPEVIEVIHPAPEVIEYPGHKTPGPPGPPGRDGVAEAIVRRAAAPLSALVVVWEDVSGDVHPLDYRDGAHIDMLAGLTITSAAAGDDVTVQRSGPLDAQGLGLMPGRVWLGTNGALTQTPPVDGFDVLVGLAVSGERLYLSFDSAIFLEI